LSTHIPDVCENLEQISETCFETCKEDELSIANKKIMSLNLHFKRKMGHYDHLPDSASATPTQLYCLENIGHNQVRFRFLSKPKYALLIYMVDPIKSCWALLIVTHSRAERFGKQVINHKIK